jgi:hypothetical protein
MPNLDRFLTAQATLGWYDRRRVARISAVVKGYSAERHYAFFKQLLTRTDVHRLLMLGVYFGRDIAFLLDIASRLKKPLAITGVDKFSNDFCEDWPQDKRTLDWESAGFGDAPTLQQASANIARFGAARVIKERDEVFLANCPDKFDAIYLDTSHDYETVCRQIRQCVPLLAADGLLMGDDYSDQGTWGVKRALMDMVPGHKLFANWIWIADATCLRPDSALIAAGSAA